MKKFLLVLLMPFSLMAIPPSPTITPTNTPTMTPSPKARVYCMTRYRLRPHTTNYLEPEIYCIDTYLNEVLPVGSYARAKNQVQVTKTPTVTPTPTKN